MQSAKKSKSFKDDEVRVVTKKKHGKLGAKANKKSFSEDEEIEMHNDSNPLCFEDYCGSCDYFETEGCPYRDIVTDTTIWWKDISCDIFSD